jgi:hypothetical protein
VGLFGKQITILRMFLQDKEKTLARHLAINKNVIK